MMLSDIKIRTAKGKEKQYKLTDGQGLYLLITPSGGKLWRFKYRFEGKEKLLSFGSYPEISLADAREKRDQARKQVAHDVDPREVRKAQKEAKEQAENTFEVVAREWFERNKQMWSPVHAETIIRRLERDVFPWMGPTPIGEIRPPEVLSVLRRIESRGAIETAHRIKTICGQVFRYAVAIGRAERDWTADLKDAPPTPIKGHHAALIDPKDVAGLLQAIDGYAGSFIVKCALQLGAC